MAAGRALQGCVACRDPTWEQCNKQQQLVILVGSWAGESVGLLPYDPAVTLLVADVCFNCVLYVAFERCTELNVHVCSSN